MISPGSDEEFVRMQTLVRNLRELLPPLTEDQSQLVGAYILSALWLGHGREDHHHPVDRYTAQMMNRSPPTLTIVK